MVFNINVVRLPVCPPVSFGPGGFFICKEDFMSAKEYKTYRQILTILRNRGMDIGKGSQGSRVMRILEKENYYNVINGYKDLFLDPTSTPSAEKYKTGTTFDELYALYNFDREVRHIYLKYLLKVENSFKTVLSHEFSSLYGHDNYLKLENFHMGPSSDKNVLKRIANTNHLDLNTELPSVLVLSAEENIGLIIKLIGDIQQEIARQMSKHHQVVTHYMSEYGYIPFWVLVNVLTFGKITTFYKLMKKNDKMAVAKKFNIPSDELHKYMDMCGLARNKCAHDERFFDISFRRRLHTRSIANFNVLGLTRDSSGSYPSGTNDAFAIAIIFSMLLSKSDTQEFVSSMKSAFSKLSKQLHTISIDEVMQIMGYNSTWTNIVKLK